MNIMQIEMLLKAHYCRERADFYCISPDHKAALVYLQEENLVKKTGADDSSLYVATPRGEAMVKYFINTPIPEETTTFTITRLPNDGEEEGL